MKKILSLVLINIFIISLGCNKIIEQRKKVYFERGKRYYEDENYSAAEREFEKVLAFDAQDFDAMYMMGLSMLKRGSFKGAADWLQKAMVERPKDLTVRLKAMETLLKTNAKQVIPLSKAVFAIDEHNQEAEILKIKALIKLDQLDEAETEIKNFTWEKGSTAPFCYKAEIYIKKGRYKDAEDIINKYYQNEKDWIATARLLIDAYRERGNHKEIEQLYLLIIEKAERKYSYQLELASFFRKTAQAGKEELLHRKMIESYPDILDIKLNFIDFLTHYRRFDEAEAIFLQEIAKNPDNFSLKKSLVNLYKQKKDYLSAIKTAKKFSKEIPPNTISFFEMKNILADLYFQSGDYEASRAVTMEVLDKSPNNRDARFNLCRLNLREGKALYCIGELRVLIHQNPEKPQYYYYLGLAHEQRGETIMAEKSFRDALELSPDYKEALLKLSSLYMEKDFYDELKILIKKYLELKPDDREILNLLEQAKQHKRFGYHLLFVLMRSRNV